MFSSFEVIGSGHRAEIRIDVDLDELGSALTTNCGSTQDRRRANDARDSMSDVGGSVLQTSELQTSSTAA
jgi:hypothetical protein